MKHFLEGGPAPLNRLDGYPASTQLDDILSKSEIPIGIISNPLSRANCNRINSFTKVIKNHKKVYHHYAWKVTDVAGALKQLAARHIKILVINGGDGTVQNVLTNLFNQKLFDRLPLLALLRAGTTNMTAGDVGLHGSKEKALQRLLSWSVTRNGNPSIQRRPVLCILGSAHQKPICGMFFGTAAIYQGVHFCKQKVHTIGLRGEIGPGLTLLLFVLALIRRQNRLVKPTTIHIGLNGQPLIENRYTLVLISTLERLFLRLRPYWGRRLAPLHFTAMRANSKYLLRVLPSALRGYQSRLGIPENGYISQNVETVHLSSSCGYTLDGEMFKMDPRTGSVTVNSAGEVSFLQI
ncbi:MAG: diacylglycerol kinase family protein [Desulfobacterales bacterium]|nr:diacylglycerol kinase family protein [Desulfobacterales bacterium]